MISKPRLSFWQVWNMSFGFLGIQFGFALQNANVSRIFQTLGADMGAIPILWIAAPVTGLIIQPIIGHMSDNTWGKLGRRRPYFLIGAILASVALFIMPNSPVLWVAAGMLWIMDASINVSMEPFRAFVGDMLPNEQRTLGFAMQSFFIGTGAVVASVLPWIMTNWLNIENTAAEGVIPPSVKFSFYAGGIVFFLAVAYTVFRTKEYSPEELEAFDAAEGNAYTEIRDDSDFTVEAGKKTRAAIAFLIVGGSLSAWFFYRKLDAQLFILSFGLIIFGLLFLIAGMLQNKGGLKGAFSTIIDDLFSMPKTMIELAWVQFFSWFALFAMWIYTTAAVTQHIYGTTDTTSASFNEGANLVGLAFAVYNGIAAIVAFLLPVLAKYTSRKITHMISLIAGGIGLASIYLWKSPEMIYVSMIGVGLAWASILSMPYAILTGSLPSNKMGVYMGIFNFFIVIPQIVAASILGFFVAKVFDDKAVYALLLGGISMVIAAFLTLLVEDKMENVESRN